MLDDVGHLVGVEPEVHGHEDAPGAAHAVEAGEQAGRVLADDGHPLALGDAERVERGGLRTGAFGDLPVGERPPRGGGLVGFVDHADAVRVHQLGPAQVVGDRQRNLHDDSPLHVGPVGEP